MEHRQHHLSASLLLLGLLSWPLPGCSSSPESVPSTGGAVGSGGTAGSGGTTSTGGSGGGGAQLASGGSLATGGTVASGGTNSGGAIANGGKPSGGTAAGPTIEDGGRAGSSSGGSTSGGSSMGGAATGGSAMGGGTTGGSAIGGAGMGGTTGGGASGAPGKSSPGCGSSDPLETGNNFTENIDGTTRKWMLDVPSGYDTNKPYRLIFVWHPLGGSGSGVVAGGYDGLKALSNNSTIFATADGLSGSNQEASGTGWWNAGGGDVKLVRAMLDKINAGLCIDQQRIFSTGFSFGGMMSYTLPFEFDVFRAVAPCSGKTDVIAYEAKFTRPIPIMAFHGNSDTFVATALGKAFFDKYAARNKCGTQTQAVSPNGCVQYQGCEVPTIWCLFQGGHTTWSEEPQAIWKFFSQF